MLCTHHNASQLSVSICLSYVENRIEEPEGSGLIASSVEINS